MGATKEQNMTPSQQAKAAGLKSLAAVTKITGVSKSTLFDWHKNKPRLFAVVLKGCKEIDDVTQDKS